MKNIAIVTGATGGIGREFVKILANEQLDEIWAFGRNASRLESLKKLNGDKIIPVCKDLANFNELSSITELLKNENPNIVYLVNNAGIADMLPSEDIPVDEIVKMVDLNCKAPTLLINYCLPYMKQGGKIINVSSAAAFQPVPYLNLYASTKAFLRSYSRALNVEMKPRGITVTAVCPGWVDTDLLTHVINGKKVKFKGVVEPDRVAQKAIKDAKKGKDMSVCSLFIKNQHLAVKLLPQKQVMKIWLYSIRRYFDD